MNIDSIDLDKVQPSLLARLAADFGWQLDKDFGNGRSVWVRDETEDVLWVPTNKSFSDYEKVIKQLIKSISSADNLSEQDVLESLAQKYNEQDLIEVRLVGEQTAHGLIPLQDGSNAFSAISKLLKNAAKLTKNIDSFVRKSYIDNAYYAQTKMGSYVVSLYTPTIADESNDNHHLIDKNQGSEISKNLFSRLRILKKIIDEQSANNLSSTLDKLLTNGFSKSEIESIDALFGSELNMEWEISAKWANSSSSGIFPSKLIFTKQDGKKINKLLVHLSDKEEKSELALLFGEIPVIKRTYEQDVGSVNLITMLGSKPVSIMLTLDDDLYQVAVRANQSKKRVKVSGKLISVKTGKKTKYYMNEIVRLEVIEDYQQESFDLYKDD